MMQTPYMSSLQISAPTLQQQEFTSEEQERKKNPLNTVMTKAHLSCTQPDQSTSVIRALTEVKKKGILKTDR